MSEQAQQHKEFRGFEETIAKNQTKGDAEESNPSTQAAEEVPVAKVVQASELQGSVQAWKPDNFAQESEQQQKDKTLEDLSSEVLYKMQEAMRPTLQKQAEVLKKEAYDKAFAQGYEEGMEKGLQEGRAVGESEARAELDKKVQPKIADFEGVLKSLEKPYELIESRLYNEMVELSLHIAKTVIAKSVDEHRDWIIEAVQNSVAQLPESKSEINVYLHPDDLAFVQISKPAIGEKWNLHENPNLAIGSCIVKQDHSSVINDWKARFSEVVEQLTEEAADIDEPAQSS